MRAPINRDVFVDLLNLANPQIAGVGMFTKNLFHYWFKDELPYRIVCYACDSVDVEKVFGFKATNKIEIRKIKVKHLLSRLLYQQVIIPLHLRHFSLYFNPAVGIPFFARIVAPKTKLLVTIHDMTPFVFPKKYSRTRSVLVKILSKLAAKVAHQIITVSENSKNDIIAFAGVEEKKINVVYNFIPPPYELGNGLNDNYFLCISTIEPGKNPEKAIEGFARFLSDTGLPFKFYWIGRLGWVFTEHYIQEYVKNNNVEDSFSFVGYVSDEDKKTWIRNCTAIVYLSFYEGFGLPVLEGMTFNKPSVVSNLSSLPEVVGETGIKCDPSNIESIAIALSEVIKNREKLIANIPLQLRKFEPILQINKFTQILENLILRE
jgi:glycosyltransferase involved in cell wall biosynthesis